MLRTKWAEQLWGEKSRFIYLFVTATIVLLTFLGGRELWTQEHRWADIVFNMIYNHDYLHPSLDGNDYYDKPLLSYWMIATLAIFTGKLTVWAMRLPSALAGLLAIWSIYRLGTRLKNMQLGLLAGWLLLTTFYFLFWARTSSADMLNMAGTLFSVTWYFEKKDQSSFFNYSVFFLILALTALCKGLVGPVAAILVIMPDLMINSNLKKHLNFNFFLGMIPAILVYVLPFWLSSYFNGSGYGENGLYLVYRENILRFFQPFDHKGPIYLYFLFLPIYLLPWAFFFIPALFSLKSRWMELSWNQKWIVWAVIVLFIFFTLSGSRRSYYVLPIVPFAILMTADWILSGAKIQAKRYVWAGRVAVIFLLILFLDFDVMQPFYYDQEDLNKFVAEVHTTADKIKPWSKWHFIMLDPESKIRFYLRLPPEVKNLNVKGLRNQQTHESLLNAWPVLKNKPKDVIFITRLSYVPLLQEEFKNYHMVYITINKSTVHLTQNNKNSPVAFIPKDDGL